MAPMSQQQMEDPTCVPFSQMLCHFWVITLSFPVCSRLAMAQQGSLNRLEITRGPENITVATETEAVLHCAVHGSPPPIVHWFKNSELLQNDSHRSLLNSGQLLFFKNVSEEDEGFYYCEAKNERERVRSRMAFLLPAVMGWSFVQQPSNVTASRKDPVTLTCRPPHSRPPARVSWFKNNRLMNPMPHISLQPNGDLLFHGVQDKDRGIYFCRASNAHLFRAVSSRKVFLNVLDPPSLEIWPVRVTAALGSTVRFQCQVSGNPPPSITWSKQGWSVLTGGKVTTGLKNATLYLSSVKRYDEGQYTCEASNAVGRAQGTASLRLAAEGDPVGDGEEVAMVIKNRSVQKSDPRHKQKLLDRMESTIKGLNSTETTSSPRYPSVPSSIIQALQSSPHRENTAPPAVQNLLLVMESRPFLFPSLNADWTPSGLGDSLKNLERLALKTDRLVDPEAFYVPHHTQIMAPQSSLDEVTPKANIEISTTSTAHLLIGSHSPSPDYHASLSKFHFSSADHSEFLPHMPYSLSIDMRTFLYRSEALSADLHSQPSDLHSQSPELHPQPPDLHSQPPDLHSQSPELHPQPPDLHSQSPDLHSQPPDPHSQLPDLHPQPPELHPQPPELHSQPSDLHPQPPDLHSQPPDLHSQPPDLHSQPPDLHSQPPDLHSQPPDLYSQAPDTHSQPPDLHSQPPDLHSQPPDLHSQPPDLHSQPPDAHSQGPVPDSPPHSPSLSEEGWVPTSPAQVHNGNQPTAPAENHKIQLTDCPKRNTSQSPMKNSDGTNSVKPQSHPWLPALEKHDIPIVVGVGVSLIFIFITMAFYSLVQKNEPAPIGRAAQRNLRGHSGHPETRRTYENRAFENDVVSVPAQNASTRATVLSPSENSVTMVMEPSNDTSAKQGQLTQSQITTPEPDIEPKQGPAQDIDYCVDGECGQCQDAYDPPPASIQPIQEERINTFLTLQTSEPCGTPIHHSVSISHSSAPLLLSHCVSVGVSTVAVDVHYCPPHSASSPFPSPTVELSEGLQLAQTQTAPTLHYVQRTCL